MTSNMPLTLQSIDQALASLPYRLGPIETRHDEGSWFSWFTARDGHVLWHFICEKSVLDLLASPASLPKDYFDADLWARLALGRKLFHADPESKDRVPRTVEDLVRHLAMLRQPVSEALEQESWPDLRRRLVRHGHQRNYEMFGKPIPGSEADGPT